MDGPTDAARAPRAHWRRVLALTSLLAAAWAGAAVLLPWFAHRLPARVGGFPLGYWLVAQGALLIFLAIVVGYALAMERLDARYRREAAAGERPLE